MRLSKICKRSFSILVVAVVAMSGPLALAEERSFDPTTAEFQQYNDGAQAAASKSKRRARKAAATPSKPSDSPASHTGDEEAPQSTWGGTYVGANVGAGGASAAGK